MFRREDIIPSLDPLDYIPLMLCDNKIYLLKNIKKNLLYRITRYERECILEKKVSSELSVETVSEINSWCH